MTLNCFFNNKIKKAKKLFLIKKIKFSYTYLILFNIYKRRVLSSPKPIIPSKLYFFPSSSLKYPSNIPKVI